MAHTLDSLRTTDLEDLSRFLIDGFHAAAGADFAAPDVLRWKYLESHGDDDGPPRGYLARGEARAIVGHLGVCRCKFAGGPLPAEGVPTFHMIDWLGSAAHRTVGVSLMRRANASAPVQFGLGGNNASLSVSKRSGYHSRPPVPVYQRVLRPAHWLRVAGMPLSRRAPYLVRDMGRAVLAPPRRARQAVEIRRVSAFDEGIDAVVRAARQAAILTSRDAARLNAMLRFPRQSMSGWTIFTAGERLAGFALLNIVPQHGGRVRQGKIVDCLLAETDVAPWHAAFLALARELARQGADSVQTYASTPWSAEALRRAGFVSSFTLEFSLRDPGERIPRDTPFHFMPIEADYAYT